MGCGQGPKGLRFRSVGPVDTQVCLRYLKKRVFTRCSHTGRGFCSTPVSRLRERHSAAIPPERRLSNLAGCDPGSRRRGTKIVWRVIGCGNLSPARGSGPAPPVPCRCAFQARISAAAEAYGMKPAAHARVQPLVIRNASTTPVRVFPTASACVSLRWRSHMSSDHSHQISSPLRRSPARTAERSRHMCAQSSPCTSADRSGGKPR